MMRSHSPRPRTLRYSDFVTREGNSSHQPGPLESTPYDRNFNESKSRMINLEADNLKLHHENRLLKEQLRLRKENLRLHGVGIITDVIHLLDEHHINGCQNDDNAEHRKVPDQSSIANLRAEEAALKAEERYQPPTYLETKSPSMPLSQSPRRSSHSIKEKYFSEPQAGNNRSKKKNLRYNSSIEDGLNKLAEERQRRPRESSRRPSDEDYKEREKLARNRQHHYYREERTGWDGHRDKKGYDHSIKSRFGSDEKGKQRPEYHGNNSAKFEYENGGRNLEGRRVELSKDEMGRLVDGNSNESLVDNIAKQATKLAERHAVLTEILKKSRNGLELARKRSGEWKNEDRYFDEASSPENRRDRTEIYSRNNSPQRGRTTPYDDAGYRVPRPRRLNHNSNALYRNHQDSQTNDSEDSSCNSDSESEELPKQSVSHTHLHTCKDLAKGVPKEYQKEAKARSWVNHLNSCENKHLHVQPRNPEKSTPAKSGTKSKGTLKSNKPGSSRTYTIRSHGKGRDIQQAHSPTKTNKDAAITIKSPSKQTSRTVATNRKLLAKDHSTLPEKEIIPERISEKKKDSQEEHDRQPPPAEKLKLLELNGERVLGEIAFQLDKRILSFVLNGKFNMEAKYKSFYGYNVCNLQQRIIETEKGEEQEIMLERYSFLMTTLNVLGYRIPYHCNESVKLVNKYGVMKQKEKEMQKQIIGIHDEDLLRSVIHKYVESDQMPTLLTLLGCLVIMASDDGMPLFVW